MPSIYGHKKTMTSIHTTYPPARNAETIVKVRAMNDQEERKRKVLLQQFEKENTVFMKNTAQEKKLFQGRLRNLQSTQCKMRSLSPTKHEVGMVSSETWKKNNNRRPVTEFGPRRNVGCIKEDTKNDTSKEREAASAIHVRSCSLPETTPSGTTENRCQSKQKDRKETHSRALTASDCFRKKMLELEREDHHLISTPPRVRHQLLVGRPRLQKENFHCNTDGVSQEFQKISKPSEPCETIAPDVGATSTSTGSSNVCLPSIAHQTATTRQKDHQQSKAAQEDKETSGASDLTAAKVGEWLNKLSSMADKPQEKIDHVKTNNHCDLNVSKDDAREWERVVDSRRTKRRFYIHPATCDVMKPRNIVSRVEEMSGRAGILAWLGLETQDSGAILQKPDTLTITSADV
ncbi:uncharacterized protein LOC118430420 [Branchiostoma floridae]|uniref:Uncharacterized protein LOC118430420 n=1 Tax=Branchiostoma floridae TaxID=7739 RepID=C3ZLY7_BRAFL|nr:uncharacterized protein LOC118430420 [Branchiostoma floridae]|eukprot:XP_002590457.1 hypothetical protein BRAFLDRAFT_124567 [Branchiostoma floridae]